MDVPICSANVSIMTFFFRFEFCSVEQFTLKAKLFSSSDQGSPMLRFGYSLRKDFPSTGVLTRSRGVNSCFFDDEI